MDRQLVESALCPEPCNLIGSNCLLAHVFSYWLVKFINTYTNYNKYTEQRYGTVGRRDGGVEQVEPRALSAAAGADEGDALALGDVKIGRAESLDRAVAAPGTFECEGCRSAAGGMGHRRIA